MRTRRERRRRRAAQGRVLTPAIRRAWLEPQAPWPRSLGRRGAAGFSGVVFLGVLMLWNGVSLTLDRTTLAERGERTTGTIVEVTGRRNPSALVRYTTAEGETVERSIEQLTRDARLEPGAPLDVLYDPRAPRDLAGPAEEDQGLRWFMMLCGSGMLLLAVAGVVRFVVTAARR